MSAGGAAGARPAHEDWIDLARAVCAVGVCFLHAFTGFATADLGAEAGPGRLALWGVARLALGRYAVPCFFMITGYLTLDPAREMGSRKVGRHLARLAGVVLTFGWAFAVAECAYDAGGLSLNLVGEGLVRALTGRSWDHLWYVYVLILVYALMGLWRRLAALPRRALGLVVVAQLCLWIAVYAALATGAEVPSEVLVVCPAPLYLLAGAYVKRHVPKPAGWVGPAGAAALVAAAAVLVHVTLAAGTVAPYVEDYGCPLMALWSLAVFERFREADLSRLGARARRAVLVLSRDSLGVYVLHPVVANVLYKGLLLSPATQPLGFVLVVWAAEVAFGVAATEVLRRLPLFRRIL